MTAANTPYLPVPAEQGVGSRIGSGGLNGWAGLGWGGLGKPGVVATGPDRLNNG